MRTNGYAHFGGRHTESANIKNLLGHAGVVNPHTGAPFTEALCFGIAGGIGAGYSFCPSVVRHGMGSGVSVVGRHKDYATDAAWYQGFFDRIGARTHVTETGGPGKAQQNLVEELEAGRPVVVWCSRPLLPFMAATLCSCGLWMHTFVVYEIDAEARLAHGADRAATRVTISLADLQKARAGVCSHKNRTLTFEPPAAVTAATLKNAVLAGIRASTQELLKGRMRTFSLPGFDIWAKMITNDKNKDGWLKVFKNGLLYSALRDVFDSIETAGTGGALYRGLYADFLDEAAAITRNDALAGLADRYRRLGRGWTELADAALPDKIKPFKQTKDLLRKSSRLFEEKGEKAEKPIAEAVAGLRALEVDMRKSFPLDRDQSRSLLEGLRERIVELHQAERDAATELQRAAS